MLMGGPICKNLQFPSQIGLGLRGIQRILMQTQFRVITEWVVEPSGIHQVCTLKRKGQESYDYMKLVNLNLAKGNLWFLDQMASKNMNYCCVISSS